MRTVLLQPPGGGEAIEVAIERVDDAQPSRFAVSVGDRHEIADLESVGATAGRLRLDGRVLAFHALRRDSTVEVWLDGRRHVLEIVDRTARRAAGAGAAGAAKDLSAPMPGKILRINAVPGEPFEAHAALIVMESMKMEMTISAPVAGRVKEVLCAEGDLVEMGELLARLEPAEESDDAAPPATVLSPTVLPPPGRAGASSESP